MALTDAQREQKRARQRRYYERHRDAEIQRVKEWQAVNPARVLASVRRRRERRQDEELRAHYREMYPRATAKQIDDLIREHREAEAKPSLYWT